MKKQDAVREEREIRDQTEVDLSLLQRWLKIYERRMDYFSLQNQQLQVQNLLDFYAAVFKWMKEQNTHYRW